MNWIKTRWKFLTIILALFLWAAWYARPVDVYGLASGMEELDYMSLSLSELGENHKDYPFKDFSPEDPEWDTALEAIESLSFHRPPWNVVLQFVPKRRITGRVTHEGDQHLTLFLRKQGRGYIQIQFFIDEWMYYSPHSNRNLTLWVEGSREAGEGLAESLRPLLE